MNTIHALIRKEYGAVLPFEQFMDLALHHPRFGYYQQRGIIFGRMGDFTTAPVLSSLPGKAIARWCEQLARKGSGARTIIEVGGGDGSMAAALLDALGLSGRMRYRLRVVESSQKLTTLQQERLGKRARFVHWYQDIASALHDCRDVIVFHNELVDAFPCALMEFREDVWQEVFVELHEDGSLHEVLRPARSEILHGWRYAFLGWHPQQNAQRVEIHRTYFDWLAGWLPHCRSLDMLTIDYGGRFPDLYHRRTRGTLRTYLMQMNAGSTNPLDHPGKQDITADVNVTDLEVIGAELGLETRSYSSLAEFLAGVASKKTSIPDARLLDSEDAGGAFFVLHQRLKSNPH